MKKLSLFMLLMGGAFFSRAQYYNLPFVNAGTNPGGINNDAEYPSGGGLPAGWTTIHSGNATTPQWSPTQTIPFGFSFNGAPVTQFKVSTSGILTFDVSTALAAPSYTKSTLPNASIPDKSVCAWGLNGIGANDFIITKTFGTAPNRQHWIQFSSYGYGTVVSDGSNFTYWSIVLEESSNNIYVVDNRTGGYASTASLSIGVQINSTSASTVAGSPNVAATTTTADPSPNDNSYYTFIHGTQPAFDLSVSNISVPNYIASGNTNITGTIKNFGTTPITSFTLNYSIGNGSTVSNNITGVNIAPLGSYNYTHPTPWNATSGANSIKVWATQLNGSNADQNHRNDTSKKEVTVLAELVQRLPLFEIYTSSTCPPCKPGNENFHSIVDTKPSADHVTIKIQQDFPGTGDPYATNESVNRRSNYYAINSIPRMEIDGGWDENANSFSEQLYASARALPAFAKLKGEYSINNKTVSGKVVYTPIVNATGMRLYVAIIENKTTKNVKSNGEREFTEVMKKMLPTETGTAINKPMNATDSLSFTYEFKGEYRLPSNGQSANRINHTTEHSVEEFTDLRVVAWLQDGNKTVLQAANLTPTNNAIVNLVNNIASVQVYPNPTKDVINAKFNLKNNEELIVSVVDQLGKVVYSSVKNYNKGLNNETINVQNLASGNYHLIVLDNHGNSSVHQVNIQ